MDPDKCLEELLELSEKVGNFIDSYAIELEDDAMTFAHEHPQELSQFLADINDLCDHVSALNGWMSNGGFIPQDWSKGRNTSTLPADSSTSEG